MRRVTTIHVLPIVAFSLALCLMDGCGGHGGRDFARVLRGVVTVTDFRVAAGERVGAEGDVTVQCQTAEVEGELVSLASTGSGANGGSITIEAQSEIVVAGRIEAGAGTDGSSTGAGGNGGTGGSVALKSAAGGVTLGVTAVVAGARPKQAGGGASLRSGDGGNGGNGTFGGAGGNGGDITIECPTGTWHITPGPDLLVYGNGGNGGNGTVPTAQLESITMPETLPNAGGDAGRLMGSIGGVDGVTVEDATDPATGQPWKLARVTEGVVGGGAGGDAGDSTFGASAAPAAQRSTRTAVATRELGAVEIVGGDGGDGATKGGDGSSVRYSGPLGAAGRDGVDVTATGGAGGEADDVHRSKLQLFGALFGVGAYDPLYGGRGGDAEVIGGAGGAGGPGQNGGAGGNALATGGHGGSANCWSVDPTQWHSGGGGDAFAQGGNGGDGGLGRVDLRGGDGGDGGKAQAEGGSGGSGSPLDDKHGPGGNATAYGGNGANGGNGNPPGDGGSKGSAVAGWGSGYPHGTETATPGLPGTMGTPIVPPPTPHNYHVLANRESSTRMYLQKYWWEYILPAQIGPMELTSPAQVVPGESMYLTEEGNLWLGTEHGVHRLDGPLQAMTDNAVFQCSTELSGPIWVDESRDLLYCAPLGNNQVLVWPNAATAFGTQAVVRTMSFPGYQIRGLTGDATADRLYLRGTDGSGQQVIVGLGSASAQDGMIWTPTAVMTGLGASGGTMGMGIAYARRQDILYVGRPQAVGIITAASTRAGAVTLRLVQGAATGIVNEPVSLDAFDNDDVLFVGDVSGAVMAFTGASALTGDTAWARRETLTPGMDAMVAWQH
ncbi:hypothetical protein LLH23_00305 [bacterium]|nr:hypothetical protein [bacterium]